MNKRFHLPTQGVLKPNGIDDPLPYYYKPAIGRLYRARIEQTLSLLTPPYGTILEIGYGSGILLPSLCKMGASVYGVDLQTDPVTMQAPLRKLGISCSLSKGDIADLHFDHDGFDLVVAISVFEHIADMMPVMERIRELLRSSGQLLIGMPRVDKLMEMAFPLIGYNNIGHHHVTNYKKVLNLARSDFRLIGRSHTPNFFPGSLALYFSMLFQKEHGADRLELG